MSHALTNPSYAKRGGEEDDDDSEEAGLSNVKVQTGPQLLQITEGTIRNVGNSTILHILGRNDTVNSLLSTIQSNCTSTANFSIDLAVPYASSLQTTLASFQSSAIVLTLDGFNQTAAEGGAPGTSGNPLPSTVDAHLVQCVNQTLALAAPQTTSGASHNLQAGGSVVGAMGLVWIILRVLCKWI